MTKQVETLEELIRETFQDTENKPFVCFLGTLNDWQIEVIQHLSGLDLTGYSHIADSFFLRHVTSRHSDPLIEVSRGQAVVCSEDFLLLPDFFNHYDSMAYEIQKGKHTLVFEKMVGRKRFVYVVELRIGKFKTVCALSLRVKSIK